MSTDCVSKNYLNNSSLKVINQAVRDIKNAPRLNRKKVAGKRRGAFLIEITTFRFGTCGLCVIKKLKMYINEIENLKF